jgi:hypothetical protein
MNRFRTIALLLIAASFGYRAPAGAQQLAPLDARRVVPFTATLSNNTPLAFGMGEAAAAQALGEPLKYISGRPGDEIYLVIRNYLSGSRLFNHRDRLYLQFRQGRLTGWKGDWGHNWMWQ